VEGDLVEVYGAVKPKPQGLTLNLEKLRVIELKPLFVPRAPRCPACGRTMESAGRGQGYRCDRCGYSDPRAQKVPVQVDREVTPGIYEVAVSARRHLVRPLRLELSQRITSSPGSGLRPREEG
jgi:tRNA(Ile2) 2-agmatinylcytidine synthetase